MLRIIRIIAVLGYFFFIALVGSLFCLFRPFNPDNTRICGRMFSWGAIKLLGARLMIEGQEHLEDKTPSVVIANHQDNIDLFVHGGVIPERTVSIGKKSLKLIPLFGQVYWLAGNIMIDRSKQSEAVNAMSETTMALKEHNTSIWVFAEGTRNHGKGLLPFKKGAFHMAVQAGAPIIPICASSYPKHMQLNKPKSCDIYVRILPPIPTENLTKKDIPELIKKTHASMKACIDELDARV